MPWHVALGQRTQSGMQSESDSDSNAAFSSFGNGSEHAVHEEDQPGPGKEDGAASHLPTEASHSQQVFISAITQMIVFNNVPCCTSCVIFPDYFTCCTLCVCIWLSMHNMIRNNHVLLQALPGSVTAVLLAASTCLRNSFLTCVGCEQDNESGDEADASQPSQTQQPSADESQQPQLPSAYHEPKKAWKKIQRTGHLAPAPGAADLTVEHNFSDEISIDSLK